MHSATTNNTAKNRLNTSSFGPRFSSIARAGAVSTVLTLSVFLGLMLVSARPALAQTESVLYAFTGGNDGDTPRSSLTSDGAGNFYGTTVQGGDNVDGTVFKLSPTGNGGWNETVLYSFCSALDCVDGALPAGPVTRDSSGNLYGVTGNGGANGYGVVFKLSPKGKRWKETVLYNFQRQSDGGYPEANLIMDKAGNLYGTTYGGGSAGYGTIFILSPSGGVWTPQTIYNFQSPGNPGAGLAMDAAGNIYSTGPSTIFELSPNGSGNWTQTILHTFNGSPVNPEGTPALDLAGNVYGTTFSGGAHSHGLVYKLTRGKTGKWTEKTLHSFGSASGDGTKPVGGVAIDAAGNVYGTTLTGGSFGYGTVFELVPPVGTGSYQEKIIVNFDFTNGAQPFDSPILDSAGNLYGTTSIGGSTNSGGVAFEVALPPAGTADATASRRE